MMLEDLYSIIKDRIAKKPTGSYVASLARGDEDDILQKIGEEATEVIIAGKGNNKQRVVEELADLYFMTFILLVYKRIPINKIFEELEKRNKRNPETSSG